MKLSIWCQQNIVYNLMDHPVQDAREGMVLIGLKGPNSYPDSVEPSWIFSKSLPLHLHSRVDIWWPNLIKCPPPNQWKNFRMWGKGTAVLIGCYDTRHWWRFTTNCHTNSLSILPVFYSIRFIYDFKTYIMFSESHSVWLALHSTFLGRVFQKKFFYIRVCQLLPSRRSRCCGGSSDIFPLLIDFETLVVGLVNWLPPPTGWPVWWRTWVGLT